MEKYFFPLSLWARLTHLKMHLWDPHSMLVAHRHALSRAVGALVHVFISHGVNGHNIHRRSFWFDCTCLLTASEQQRQSKATIWAGYSFHIHSQNWGSFQGYRTTPWNFILRAWFLLWITVYSQITRNYPLGWSWKLCLIRESSVPVMIPPVFVPA